MCVFHETFAHVDRHNDDKDKSEDSLHERRGRASEQVLRTIADLEGEKAPLRVRRRDLSSAKGTDFKKKA